MLDQDAKEEVKRLLKEGKKQLKVKRIVTVEVEKPLSLRDIAERFGTSYQTILTIKKELQ